MARLWQTGWEMGHNGICDLAAVSIVTTPTAGPWSTYAAQCTDTSGVANLTIGTSVSEFYWGARMLLNTAGAAQTLQAISPNSTCNLSVQTTAGQVLEVRRGANGTVLATGTTVLALSRWYFIELYGLINSATGKVQLKLDGVDEIALQTGLNTRNDGGANGDKVDRIGFGMSGVAHQWYVDESYFNDTTGSQNTGFSGDIRISAYIPNASGDSTQLTPTAGSNYACVDERPPNDATDYVYDAGTANYDLYNIPNTTGIATVQAVSLWLRAQKSDAGAKSIAHKLKSGSTEDTGADIALSTSWTYYGKHYSNDPTTSTAWTPSKVDSLQIGAKAR